MLNLMDYNSTLKQWAEIHLNKKIIPPVISQPTNYDPLSVEGHQEVSKIQ